MKINNLSYSLIMVLATVVIIVVSLTLSVLYEVAFEQQRSQLIATVKSQARLMEAVARFDIQFSITDDIGGSDGATLSQIEDAHEHFVGFGKTGEFVLAKKKGNKIVFLSHSRFGEINDKALHELKVTMGSPFAVPVQLALSGESGAIVAMDYRKKNVLAAYEPVGILDYAVIAKIDLSEVREPFIIVGLISLAVALILIVVGGGLFVHLSNPVLRRLGESEESSRMLFDQSPIGLALCRMDGSIEVINNAYAEIIGRSIEETKTLSYWDITPQEYADDEQEQLDHLKTRGSYGPYEKEYIHKDGHRVAVSLLGQLIEKDGETYIWSSVEDISERKKTDYSMLMSEERLNEAQRISKVGSWELNLLTNELVWSDEIFRIFELDKDVFDASYEAFLNAIHPEDRDKVNKAYSDSLINRSPYKIVHRLLMSDGRIKYVEETCKSFFDDDGKPVRSVGTVQDITELTLAQTEIQNSKARFESVFESIPDAIIYADSDRNIQLINDAAIDLFGYKVSELTGNNTKMLYASIDDFNQQGKKRYNPDAAQIHDTYEVVYKCKDGREFVGETLGTAVKSINGEVLGFLGIVRDITGRKKIENDLDNHRLHLEELVKDRTSELTMALDAAEYANAAKSEFLSRMSHELRTPMNAILGFTQMLGLDIEGFSDTQQESVNEIMGAGQHLMGLINEVLDLARIESGKMEISMEEVVLEDVLQECISMLLPQVQSRQLKLIDNISIKGYRLHSDFTRLKQVVLNLLSNAVKYNSDNGSITLDSELISEQRLRITVSDTGQGLTENEISKLFISFERLNPVNNVEGTGIGLVITKHLVNLMKGDIGIDSVPGVGSTFWIELDLINE